MLRRTTSSLTPERTPLDERTVPVPTVAPVRPVTTRTDELRSVPPPTRLEDVPVRDVLEEATAPPGNDSRRVDAAADVR